MKVVFVVIRVDHKKGFLRNFAKRAVEDCICYQLAITSLYNA